MEKLKKRSTAMLKKLGKSFRKNFPVVILGILLCFLVRFMFGRANVVTALVSIIGIRELYGTTIKLTNYMRYGITLLAVVLLGTFGGINVFAAVIINFIVIGFTAFALYDNLQPAGAYFTISLQVLLMEYSGEIAVVHIPRRLLCVLFCMTVSGAVLLVVNNFFRKHKDDEYVIAGCKAIADKLGKFVKGEAISGDKDLFSVTSEFCRENYSSFADQFYILDESKKRDFLSLMTLEQISDLVYDTETKLVNLNENDKEYFEELIRIFARAKSIKRLAIELNGFVDDYSISNPQLSSLWKKYLLSLVDYAKYKNKPVIKKGTFKEAFGFRLSVLKKRFSYSSSYNLRKALQIASIVALFTGIAKVVPVTEAMVFPIAAFCVLSVYPEVKLRATIPGIAGIIALIVIYMLVLGAVPFDWRLPVSYIISVLGISVTSSHFMKAGFSVQLISSVVFPTAVMSPEIIVKIGMVLLGSCLSWLLVKWIFNTPNHKKYKLHISDLAQVNWTSMSLLQNSRLDNSATGYLCEFMFIQHLMLEHISNSSKDLVDSNRIRYSNMLSFNCDLLTEIAYAMTVLKPVALPGEWIIAMKKRLTNVF